MSRKAILTTVVVSLLTMILIGIGVFTGHWLTESSYQRHFRAIWKEQAPGRFLEEDAKFPFSRAYRNPETALFELDRYSWSVPNVPTPFVGSGPRPGTHGNADINSQQFRDRLEIRIPKPTGIYRIFLTGGSTAFGAGAPHQDQTIGKLLEQLLNQQLVSETRARRFEVFTLANPSWASTHERIVIENRLSELEPDLVISLSGINDVHWGLLGRNILWFRTYQEEAFWRLTDAVYRTFGQEPLTEVIEVAERALPPAEVAQRLEKNVRLAKAVLSWENVPYLFVLQPSLYHTGKPLSPRETERFKEEHQAYFAACYRAFQDALLPLSDNLFFFLNLTPVFDHLDARDEVFLDSYHLADFGNALVAEALFGELRGFLMKEAQSTASSQK